MRIEAEHVSFSYPGDVQALKDINLRLEAGESVAIVGENGAGKSTLARLMNGLLKPTAGRVLIGELHTSDHSVAHLSRHVAYLFQNPDDQLFASTVEKEIAFGPKNLGCSQTEIVNRTQEALQAVGLSGTMHQHPYDLHAAQRKLVALAATLAMQTQILILDEPTTGQDAKGMRLIGSIIKEKQAAGTTVLIISHDMDFCVEHAHRVIVLSQGRIIADGPTAEIMTQMAALEQADINPPQLIRLAKSLGLPAAPLCVSEFLDLYLQRYKREGQGYDSNPG